MRMILWVFRALHLVVVIALIVHISGIKIVKAVVKTVEEVSLCGKTDVQYTHVANSIVHISVEYVQSFRANGLSVRSLSGIVTV